MANRRRFRSARALPAILALAAIVAGCGSSPNPSAPTASPDAVPSPTATLAPATPSSSPQPTPSPTATPTLAIVPVADFRTTATTVDAAGVAAILAGTNKAFTQLELVTADADGILAALGLDRTAAGTHLVLAATDAALATDIDTKPLRLGFLRASQVGPSVRALAWGAKSLFGVARVSSLADWPLSAVLDGASTGDAFDPAQTWTIAAGGDMMLDRGVYTVLVTGKKGPDYPFNGGTVAITTRYCCSSWGWVMPRFKVTDTTPVVRNLFTGADLAMANLEGPAPVHASYHATGMSFTFQQSLLTGLKNAGLDVVSLANNHIGNAGRQGVTDTELALDKLGIKHAGADASSSVARAPALFTVDGVKVAFFGRAAFTGYSATINATTPADIRAAKAAGAQVVIVYPHWGTEYKATANATQRRWAHAMIDAGADLIIGNHPHWAGAMENYKGKPIWYALGNFVFDQNWSEETEEGLLLELSFNGSHLVQAWQHPTLILDKSQPNFLDAASGQVVLNRVFGASKGLLSW
jgi:poly-gamma-glutamate synthesis protein (capsule biosynthesis protein)